VTWKPLEAVQVYASVSEASRAPSPVELTCADPNDPCRLPNAFLSDPPLEQVVSRTLEAGARAEIRGTHLHLGVFRTTNRDDILFISAGALTNEGYFDNVGRTRRQGIEAGARGALADGRFAWFLDVSLTDAHFMQAFSVASPNHPLAAEDEIHVARGDRIPSIPKALAKLGFEYSPTSRWDIGADFAYASSQYFRGDEANLSAPVPASGVLNVRTSFDVGAGVTLFAFVENVMNRHYATFGTFGEPDEVLGDEYDDARFISPGAPRGVWLGLSIDL
jgi:iron complex outermembrane recepter protein